jgi:ABC-type antimicrobial peptide transport system permease subunit
MKWWQLRKQDADLERELRSDLELSQTRFPALTLSLFACTALILASIGVYGVLAYSVVQGGHDIGVRMALGAQQGQILRFYLGQGARWAAFGGCAGLVAALVLVRFMRSMLFQIAPYDPKVFLAVAVLISIVVLLACSIPALRAAKVDPLIALKSE